MDDFETDMPTAEMPAPTEDELAWAEVMARQRAKTKDLRGGSDRGNR